MRDERRTQKQKKKNGREMNRERSQWAKETIRDVVHVCDDGN